MAKVCAFHGCNLAVFVEPRTSVSHKYCGRTHARMAGAQLKTPHGACMECNLDGCTKPVAFDSSTGRVHDFCCKQHAQIAINNGSWVRPMSQRPRTHSSSAKMCAKAGCCLQACRDPQTGRLHDYCGRTHAVEAGFDKALKSMNSNPGSTKVSGVAVSRLPVSTTMNTTNPPIANGLHNPSQIGVSNNDSNLKSGYSFNQSGVAENKDQTSYNHLKSGYASYVPEDNSMKKVTLSSGISGTSGYDAAMNKPVKNVATVPNTWTATPQIKPSAPMVPSTSSYSSTISSQSTTKSIVELDICTICLESFINGKGLIKTVCSHIFHKCCVDDWATNKKECPICRQELNYKVGN